MTDLRKFYLDWPHEVSIETFAKCNASCSFCPYTTLERQGTKLSDEVLDRIVEELKDHPWPFILSPFKVSEPLLDKRLIPFCQKVNDQIPNANLRIFTNGQALTDKHIASVAGLRNVLHLWCSLNDYRPDAYKELMGIDFERTVSNLDRLHEAVCAGEFKHPVMISRVRDSSEHDEAFADYVRARYPRFGVWLIKRDAWLGFLDPEVDVVPDTTCNRWFELSITATGVVSHCCMDGEAAFPIGDITKQSLFEVYNSPAWRKNRLTMWSRKNVHPCSTCSY